MECEKVQQRAHEAVENGQSFVDEDKHLETCPACAALVQDLQYIAQQAKLLLPLHNPDSEARFVLEAGVDQENLLQSRQRSDRRRVSRTPSVKEEFPSIHAVVICAVAMLGALWLWGSMRWGQIEARVIASFGFGLILFLVGFFYLVSFADNAYDPFKKINDLFANEANSLEKELLHHFSVMLDTMITRMIKETEVAYAAQREVLFTHANRIRERLDVGRIL
jgi:hypothetical protein